VERAAKDWAAATGGDWRCCLYQINQSAIASQPAIDVNAAMTALSAVVVGGENQT
jgi:hypothetical protein